MDKLSNKSSHFLKQKSLEMRRFRSKLLLDPSFTKRRMKERSLYKSLSIERVNWSP